MSLSSTATRGDAVGRRRPEVEDLRVASASVARHLSGGFGPAMGLFALSIYWFTLKGS